MSENTPHTPRIGTGSPVWIDYTAANFARQKAFYSELFGWSFEDQGEEFGHYCMIRAGDHVIGGAMDADLTAAHTGEPAQPAAWSVYLKTDDIDATAAATREHGGQVVVEPMGVGPLGRMALAMSAGGEAVGFWQPGEFAGHDLPLAEGTSVWFEVMSTDYDADAEFYRQVAGWDVAPMGPTGETATDDDEAGDDETGQGAAGASDDADAAGDMPRYATNFAGERATSGLCDASAWLPEGTPSYWRVYFQVADTPAALATIEKHGGRVLDGPMDSPFGRVTTVADPAGATFQLNQPL